MAQLVDAMPFDRMAGGHGMTAVSPSVDVNTILRNLKLRRESCTSFTAPALSSSDYDTVLPRSPRNVPSEFVPISFSGPSLGAISSEISRGHSIAEISASGSDASDIITNWRIRQGSILPSSRAEVRQHYDAAKDGPTSPGGVQSAVDGRTSFGAPLSKLTGMSSQLASFPISSSFHSLSTGVPEDVRFSGSLAPAPVDATAEVTMLIPSSSVPSAPSLNLTSHGVGKSTLAPIPLKAASSMTLLGDHGATPSFKSAMSAAPSKRALAAAYDSPVDNGIDATLFSAASRQLSGHSGNDGVLESRNNTGDVGRGRSRGSSGGSGGSGGGGGSRSASPSLRLGGVAATAFAAASAIVAATSAAAAASSRSALPTVSAAAVEGARETVADTAASGRRSPPVVPQSPNARSASMMLTMAVSSPSRPALQPESRTDADNELHGYGGAATSYERTSASLRRSSLEVQIARLKGALGGHFNGSVETSNDRASSYSTVTSAIPTAVSATAAQGSGWISSPSQSAGFNLSASDGACLPTASSSSSSSSAAAATATTVAAASTVVTPGSAPPTSGIETDALAAPRCSLATSGGPSRHHMVAWEHRSPEQQEPCRSASSSVHADNVSGNVSGDSAANNRSSGGGGGGGGGCTAGSRPLSPGSCHGVMAPPPNGTQLLRPFSGAGGTVAPTTTTSTTSTCSASSVASQRSQLLEELHSAHRRELALAEQLGRARGEVLELTVQLTRQVEAAASANAAAEAEAAKSAELRAQLRKERAEASEEVRRWRSRATAAEEQLQTALTQLACLRSAAAAAAAAAVGCWTPTTTQTRRSAGGGSAGATPVAVAADSYSGRMAVVASPCRTIHPSAMAESSQQRSPQGKSSPMCTAATAAGEAAAEAGPNMLSQHVLTDGTSSPMGRCSPPDVDGAASLRRSRSDHALSLEAVGVDGAKPPRAVSTSGGAREEGGKCDFDDGSSAAAAASSAPPSSPPDGAASSAATTVAATAGAADDLKPASTMVMPYGTSHRSPSFQECDPYTVHRTRCSLGGGGVSEQLKSNGSCGGAVQVVDDEPYEGGVKVCNRYSSAGGGVSNFVAETQPWATAATAAAAGRDAATESTQIHALHSVPNPNSVELSAGIGGPAMDRVTPLESSASADVPGAVSGGGGGGGGNSSSKTRFPGGAGFMMPGGLPVDIAALTAVPEGVDGTAVLQSAGAPPSTRTHGSGAGKGEAAAVALLVAEVERLKQAGNRAYRCDQFPLARHCYTCAMELLLAPAAAAAVNRGGAQPAAAAAVGCVNSDGGGALHATAAALAAARERERATLSSTVGSGAGGGGRKSVPGEQRMISALYCSRAAAHVAMRLYADAVADCCAASAHDEAYAKPWKCRAEALASVNAFGPAAAALERCIQLTMAAAAAAATAASAAARDLQCTLGATSVTTGGGGELLEYSDVDPRELPLLRHILHRLQELARAAAAPAPPAAAALLAAVAGAPSIMAPPVDHYAVLGVPYHASAVDVRAAYRRLALRYHPDKAAAAAAVPTPSSPTEAAAVASSPVRTAVVTAAGTVFPMVAEAYSVLSDNASRRAYDLRRARVALSNKRPGPK